MTGDAHESGVERNYAAFLRHACRFPGAEFHETPHAAWASTGLRLAPLNTVVRARWREDEADAGIEGVLSWFRERGIPFGWWHGPGSAPRDLGDRLLAHGLRYLWTSPALWRPLDARAQAPVPEGVTVERVQDARGLERYLDALIEGFQVVSAEDAAGWRHVFRAVGVDPAGALRHYVALERGRPIGSASAFLHGDEVGLYNISTVPGERGRGVGSALTVIPMEDARADGARSAVLLASHDGEPVYRRLGFRDDGPIAIYEWAG